MKKEIIKGLIIFSALITHFTEAANISVIPKATATLASSCSISATNIDFGYVPPPTTGNLGWTTTTFTGNLSVTCSNNLSYYIDLSDGLNGNFTDGRFMKGQASGDKIHYAFCQTSTLTINGSDSVSCGKGWWTKSRSTTLTYSSKGTGDIQNIPVYAFVQRGYYTPDIYSDTIVATITY